MNLRRWEYFLKAAELGSLSRVAERLDISQPALSRQISALEAEVGAPLFYRTGRGLALTPAGEVFRVRAEAILEAITRIPEEVVQTAQTPSGPLAFGAPPFLGRALTGKLVAEYLERFPKVRMRVRGAHSFHLREAIFQRDLDVGILAAPLNDPDLQIERLLREDLYIVAPAGSPVGRGGPVSLDQVADLPLILTPRPDGLRALIETGFAQIGRRVQIAVETEYAPMDELISRGVGHAIMPFSGKLDSPLTQFSWTPIKAMHVTWLVGSLQSVEPTLAARRLTEMIFHRTRELVRSGLWQGEYLGPED